MTVADKKITSLFCSCLAFGFFSLPFVFRWYISDSGRYITMIHGPYPWSHMGSVGYQLVGTIITPLLMAIGIFTIGRSFRSPTNVQWIAASERPVILRALGLSVILIGLILDGMVFIPPMFWN